MSGHTPGPWQTSSVEKGYIGIYAAAADKMLCALRSTDADDANLIAAAPELYDACQAFLVKWALVLPAIEGAFLLQHMHGGHYAGPTLANELQQMHAALAKAKQEHAKAEGR